MKRALLSLPLMAAMFWIGCGKSESSEKSPPPAPEVPEAASAPAAPPAPAPGDAAPSATLTEQAGQAVEQAKAAAGEWVDSFKASLEPSADPLLKDIGGDIVTRAEAAVASFQGEAGLKDKLTGAVEALTQGEDGQAIGFMGQLSQAQLTDDQKKTLGDLRNAVNAYVVQRNFSGLTDANTELGKVVTALRGGDTTTALTQLKQMTSKVSLTPEQSSLLNQMVDQYAPALKDAGKALEEGVKNLNPFGQ